MYGTPWPRVLGAFWIIEQTTRLLQTVEEALLSTLSRCQVNLLGWLLSVQRKAKDRLDIGKKSSGIARGGCPAGVTAAKMEGKQKSGLLQ